METGVENKMSLIELTFESGSAFNPDDTELKNLLKLLEETTKENEQKKYIKQIVDFYKSSTDKELKNYQAKKILLQFFTSYGSKKILKKYLQDVISEPTISTSLLKSITDEILGNIKSKKCCNMRQCIDLLNFVYLMQTTPNFQYEIAIEYVFPLYSMLFEGFIFQLLSNVETFSVSEELLNTLMNAVLKQILFALVKIIPYTQTISKDYSMKFIYFSHTIIMNEKLSFDLKTKSGLIIMYCSNILPDECRSLFKYKDCPPLEFLEDYNDKNDFILMDYKFSTIRETENIVIIYSSILSVLPHDKLLQMQINEKALVCVMFNALLECAQRKTCVSHIIIEISRTLSIIGKHLTIVPPDLVKPLFLEAIAFIWSHIEHFVDTVRNYAKQFFADIAMVAVYHKNKGYGDLVEILVEYTKHLSLSQVIKFLALENIALYLGAKYLLQRFDDLQDIMMTGISDPTIAEQVCKTYISIMEKHFQEEEKEEWIKFWITPVARLLKSCNKCTVYCQRIMTRAFQLHPVILRHLYPSDYIGNSQESSVLLKCLHYARMNGVELSVDKTKVCLYWRGLIDKEKLMKFAVHLDDEIRLSVLTVVVDSQKTTEMFTDWELEFLLAYIHYNITSQIPNVRKQVIALYKKALTRYSTGFYVITRNISFLTKKLARVPETHDPEKLLDLYQEINEAYQCFIRKFTKLLISYLTFDSNHLRRSTTLELLINIQSFYNKDQWRKCWTEDDIKNCHNILFDSYESNKKMAVTLLKTLPQSAIGFNNVDFTFKYMQRCVSMAEDLKPSITLSAAYLLEVCTFSPYFYEIVPRSENEENHHASDPKLDMIVVLIGKLCSQQIDIEEISEAKNAVYGLLLSLRHILASRDLSKDNNEAYCGVFEHIVQHCDSLGESILPIVCNPAPEGYLPDSGEVLCDKDESSKAQKVLCYAWRTIKEMTLLLAEIVKQTIALEGKTVILAEGFLIKIGKFFFDIFVGSKHKGVFEKAYVGFSVICECFWKSTNPNINQLPKKWLQDALDFCTGKKLTDKLCPTRRSAGLPFLVLAILSTELIHDRPNFHSSMKILLKTCEDTFPDDHRTHCMNVLRIIYRHSKLGEAVSSYVAAGVIVVINCFQSKSWMIRNSATLLFSSLMTRMFGVQRTNDSEDLSIKNRLTIRVFFLRYPELFEYLLKVLADECHKHPSLVIYPVLMILARLYPSQLQEYKSQVEKYLPHITVAFSNPYFRTRDLAARASVPLIPPDKASEYVIKCFEKIGNPHVKDNLCQGLLLQIYHIVKSNHNLEIPMTECLKNSVHLLESAGTKFSHMTISLYLEVVLTLLMKFREYDDIDMLKEFLTLISKQITMNLMPMTSMGRYLEIRMLVVLFVVVNKFEECDVTYSTVTNQIMSQLYGHDMEMKKFCLNLLIYLNQMVGEPGSKHALFQTEELQIPPEITMLVDSFEKSCINKILTHIHPYLKCFLTEELKFQHYIKPDDQVLLFLVLNYYPCVIKYLNLSKQETLNMLINFCKCDNDELISAVVSCISTFLLQLDYNVLTYNDLIKVLVKSASPAASDFQRLAVCDFLSKNYILYCNEEPILTGDDLQTVLNMVMVLLEDDEMIVRNAMSSFASSLKVRITLNKKKKQTFSGHRWSVLPERAREDLLNLCFVILPKDQAVSFLFSWTCRHFPDSSNDMSEVFERGEVNIYAENVPLIELCVCLLNKLLWSLEDGLSYDDRSIFLEEQTLRVTTILLDALSKYSLPMLLKKTKLSVICALRSIISFLERFGINDNFVDEFRNYMDNTIVSYLSIQVDHSDLYSVKRIVKRLYEPVLTYEKE